MRFSVRPSHGIVFGALVFLCRVGGAQAPAGGEARRANATRQELERLAAEAETSSVLAGDALRDAKRREAQAIRERLREGDFRPGDRIVLHVQGDSTLRDTVLVLPGATLKVLSLPEDSLRGVLRSELQLHLTEWVTRFYKNATVRAIPLIRFGVLGEVNRPGYYRLPIDIAVTDAIMSAGGPTQRADMPKTVVRRRARELLSKGAVRDAMAAGLTLDQLGLDAGDELVVGAKSERSWMNVVQVASMISGLAVALLASRRF
jgi:SLBB domain-containing protein